MCFVLIKSILLNLLCVWILFSNTSSHSCFRFSQFFLFNKWCWPEIWRRKKLIEANVCMMVNVWWFELSRFHSVQHAYLVGPCYLVVAKSMNTIDKRSFWLDVIFILTNWMKIQGDYFDYFWWCTTDVLKFLKLNQCPQIVTGSIVLPFLILCKFCLWLMVLVFVISLI